MFDDFGQFIFLAAGAIALFSFLSVGAWAGNRTAERIAIERLALYRKLAESPTSAIELVLAHLREEEARQESKDRERARRSRVPRGTRHTRHRAKRPVRRARACCRN